MKDWTMNQKKLLIALASVLALIVAGLLTIPLFIDAARIKNIIITQLESNLQRQVRAGDAEMTVFTGLGFRLKDTVISEDPRFGPTPFVRVESLTIRPKLLPLIFGRAEIGSIHLVKPVVHLVKGAAGVWNFESISKETREEPREKERVQPAEPRKAVPFAVSELHLQDGSLSFRDQSRLSSVKETRYEHINLELHNLSTSKSGTFFLEVQLPSTDKHSLKAAGKIGPLDADNFQKTHIDGKIKFSEVPLADLRVLLFPFDQGESGWEGNVSTESFFKGNLAEAIYLNGKTGFSKLSAKRLNLESPEIRGEFQYTFNYQPRSGSIQLEKALLQFPNSAVNIAGTMKSQNEQSLLDLKVDSQKASINDLLRLVSLFGQGPPKGVDASGDSQFRLQIAGTTKSPKIAGQASFSNFQISYPGFKEKIVLSPLLLKFENARMSSNELQIAVGERTRLKAQLAANFAPEKFLSLNINSQNPVPVADLLAIGSSFGVTLPEGFTMQNGTVDLQVEAKKLPGAKPDLHVRGKASLNGSQLRAPVFKVPLDIKKANLNFTGNSVNVSDLIASLNGSNLNGGFQLANFDAPTLNFGLNIDQLDLAALDSVINSSKGTVVKKAANSLEPLPHFAFGSNLYAAKAKPPIQVQDPLASLTIRDSLLTVQKVKYDTLLLNNASSKIRMKSKLLELQDLQFQMNRGTHTGRAAFDFTGTQPGYTFNSKLKNVDANEFLSQNTSLKNLIYGTLSSDIDLKGYGSGFDQITKGLKGGGKLSLTNGRITAFNLTEQITLLGKLTGLYSGHSGTDINQLEAKFQILNGRVLTDITQMRIPNATLRATGNFGLDKTIDYQIMAELPGNLSKRYGAASEILDFATATFFKNEQGNLVVPLRLTGSVSRPSFDLDTRVVQENLRNRFTREGPKKALEALQDALKPKRRDEPSSPPESNQDPTSDKSAPEKPPEKKSSPLEELFKGVLDKAKEKKNPEKQSQSPF